MMSRKALYTLGGIVGFIVVLGAISGDTPAQEQPSMVTPRHREVATATPVEAKATTSAPVPVVHTEPKTTAVPKQAVASTPQIAYYSVTKVVDGDTITISINGTLETLRLIGINTPETVDPRKPVECFGKKASDKAKVMLVGKKVRIEKDPTQGERDKYARLLAYVFLEDGTFFNKYMIAEGYAYEYTYNLPYKYQAEFKEAQRNAQAAQKGLWAPGVCETAQTTPSTATTPAPTSQPQPASSGGYICDRNAYNCTDFKTQTEAQRAFDACGGTNNDIHKLDNDKDGRVCETLP